MWGGMGDGDWGLVEREDVSEGLLAIGGRCRIMIKMMKK